MCNNFISSFIFFEFVLRLFRFNFASFKFLSFVLFIILLLFLYSYQNVEDKFTQIGKAVVDAPM